MNKAILLAALLITVAAASAGAADLPKRKSGLWEINMTSAGGAGGPAGGGAIQMCIDEKTDDLGRQAGAQMQSQCSKNEVRREGANRVVTESVCKMGGSTVTTRGTFTGDFATGYTIETRSTYDPPMMGMREGSSKGSAKWLGPCKPDMKPGDMILSNGMRFNMNDMPMKGAPR